MRIIKQGMRVLNDGNRAPVRVVGFDYDFWYQERSTRSAVSDEEVPLGEGGFLYYVCFPEIGDSLTNPRVDTEAFATPDEAIIEAEALVVGHVEWFS